MGSLESLSGLSLVEMSLTSQVTPPPTPQQLTFYWSLIVWFAEYPFEDELEKSALMKHPGGNPLSCLLADEKFDADLVLSRLKPYRCAVVEQDTSFGGPSAKQENVMTARDVRCHVYPQEGMYTVIKGHVYDLSGNVLSLTPCRE